MKILQLLWSGTLVLDAATAQAAGPTDPQIAAIVVTANQVDIDAATLAKTKSHSKDVKEFAQLMITDHSAVNKSATELVQKLHVTPEGSPTSQTLQKGGDDNLAALHRLGRAQMRDLLERKLDELPENFRTVFVLRSVEEMSVDETAGCLGIPGETVRSRHFRAKTMLRESLAQELNLAERDVFQFGGAHCDRVVANVLARLATCS